MSLERRAKSATKKVVASLAVLTERRALLGSNLFSFFSRRAMLGAPFHQKNLPPLKKLGRKIFLKKTPDCPARR
jgi:hypothetical protein